MRISDWSSDVCSSDLQQHRKGLPYRVVKSRLADFLPIDGVGLAQYVAELLGHLTRNTDGEAGARERVPSDKGFRKAEFPAKLAHLVLEQFATRLQHRQARTSGGQGKGASVRVNSGGTRTYKKTKK